MTRNAFGLGPSALALIAGLAVSGCARQLDQVDALGATVLDQKEAASALVLKGCVRYQCRSGRIGPVLDQFATPEQRAGWDAICKIEGAAPALP